MRGWIVGLQVAIAMLVGLAVSEVVAPRIAAAMGWDGKQLLVLKAVVTALMVLGIMRSFAWIERRRS